MKYKFFMLGAGGFITVVAGSMLVWLMFAPDPSCAETQKAERVEKQALTLIPSSLVISAETIDDCDSGGPIYQEVMLVGTADVKYVLSQIDGRPRRTHLGQFAAVEKEIDGTWVRYSFDRRVGKLEVTIELA